MTNVSDQQIISKLPLGYTNFTVPGHGAATLNCLLASNVKIASFITPINKYSRTLHNISAYAGIYPVDYDNLFPYSLKRSNKPIEGQ